MPHPGLSAEIIRAIFPVKLDSKNTCGPCGQQVCSSAAREHNIMICITRIPLLLLWYNAGGRYILILYYHGDLRWDILWSIRVFSTTTITKNAPGTGYRCIGDARSRKFPLPSARLWSFFTYIFSYDKIYCRIYFAVFSQCFQAQEPSPSIT